MHLKTLHRFPSRQVSCEADLYLPSSPEKPAVVILAQGYACERGFGTQNLIRAIVDNGIAVFAFDYRGFGGSDAIPGEPRQLVDPREQVKDWHAAISYVSSLDTVDGSRLGIWGSSFAGGHVVSVAGSDWINNFSLKAVVSQIPHTDSRNAFKLVGFRKAMQGGYHGIKGVLLDLFGKSHTVPVVGKPDKNNFAVMQHPGWYEGYLGMVQGETTWKNEIPAKSLLRAAGYNPVDVAHNITASTLVVYGLKDQGIPRDEVEACARKIKNAELFAFDGDHFDVYDGGIHQPAAVAKEVEFFRRILL